MPKQKNYRSAGEVPDEKRLKKPRIAANGHRLPDQLPRGEILTDMIKRKWRLGKSVGLGGFGEIYLASNEIEKQPGDDAKYVIKIEPHTNGPLFSEMHFYYRVGKPEQIEEWMKKKKLKFLGMPKFIGSGSHETKGVKYRFMILERFGEDLQKLLEKNNRVFPIKTVYTLGMKILDVLEYVHSHGYIHADVKASNLTSGFGKGRGNEVHLIDFGLACKYISNGVHKEFKEDLRKAHDGTLEYTSRDAHLGAHSRRGDLEILGYNMLQWICGYLPWEDNLKDPEYVAKKKNMYMKNIPSLIEACFPGGTSPRGIMEYLTYVVSLKFEEEPNYSHCSSILKSAIKACGFSLDGKLVYISKKSSFPQLSRKRCAPKNEDLPLNKKQKTVPLLRKMASESAGLPSIPCKKVRRVASATPRLQTAKPCQPSINEYMSTIDNPTPAMLLVLQRKLEQLQQQSELHSNKNGVLKNGTLKDKLVKSKCSITSSYSDADDCIVKITKFPVATDKAGETSPIRSMKRFPKRRKLSSASENKVHLEREENYSEAAVSVSKRSQRIKNRKVEGLSFKTKSKTAVASQVRQVNRVKQTHFQQL